MFTHASNLFILLPQRKHRGNLSIRYQLKVICIRTELYQLNVYKPIHCLALKQL